MDYLVREKLKLIDSEYAWRTDFHNQLFSHCPLAVPAVGFIGGIVIQSVLEFSIFFWLGVLFLCAFSLVLISFKRGLTRPRAAGYLVLAGFVCVGGVRLISFSNPGTNDISSFAGESRVMGTVRGEIITEPYLKENKGWRFAGFSFQDNASNFYLKVDSVKCEDGWRKADGKIFVRVAGGTVDLKRGDVIEADCWLERLNGPRNPGEFDWKSYCAKRGIYVAASVNGRDAISLMESKRSGWFAGFQGKLKQIASGSLLAGMDEESQSYGLVNALLLGERGDIDPRIYDAFKKTGLLHFISLSGLHVGIMIWLVWFVCRTAGLYGRSQAIICIIAIGIFLMIVPSRGATVRAGIVGLIFCSSYLFGKKPDAVNTLSLAALILLLFRPTQLFEAGWQLSFSCVLGILLFQKRIDIYLRDFIGVEGYSEKSIWMFLQNGYLRSISMFAMGLAAWIGGVGILVYHFNRVNFLTPLWTIIIFPFIFCILAVGFLKMAIGMIFPSLGAVLTMAAKGLAAGLVGMVRFISEVLAGDILVGKVSVGVVVFYYAFAAFAGLVYLKQYRVKRAVCYSMLIMLVGIPWAGNFWGRDKLILSCLDVGHGQAILVRAGGENLLFDAGAMHKSDAGRKIILPFLDHEGLRKIDAVFLSHRDIDHINALPEIVESGRVGKIYGNVTFFDESKREATVKVLKEALGETGFKIEPLDGDLDLDGKMRLKVLWPVKSATMENLSDNDRSSIFLLEYGGRKILLCSDIEKYSQKMLLESYPNLRVDVMVVPHHGSASTLLEGFIEKLEPLILVYSCGPRQWGKQAGQRQGVDFQTYFTARDGAIDIEIGKNGGIEVNAFLNHDCDL